MNSIRVLFNLPYNKKHPLFALGRFIHWKLIRLMKMKNIKYRLWEDRAIFLDHDSLQSMWIMYSYILDWEEFNLISRYVQPEDHIMDIGANLGAYSVWMSKFISASGKIHSFEPDLVNYDKLMKNIRLNKIEGMIRSNKCALSDVDGTLNFTTGLDRLNHIANEPEGNVVSIESRKLDTYFRENDISCVTYAKIDVEGFEYTVLKGATEIIREKRIEILQLEINDTISNSGVTADSLLALLDQYNYVLCSYDVEINRLSPVGYSREQENYFAVFDLEKVNKKLKSLESSKTSAAHN